MDKEILLEENKLLKRQLKELLSHEDLGFFVELNSLLQAIYNKTLLLCEAESSFFSLTGRDPSILEICIQDSVTEKEIELVKAHFKTHYAKWVETNQPIITIDNYIILPLLRRGRLLGVIGIKPSEQTPDNIYELLPILAAQAASSLESAILYERMFKRLLVLSNLFALGKEIVSNIDLQSLLNRFLSILRDAIDSEAACIFLINEKESEPYYSQLQTQIKTSYFSPETNDGFTPLVRDAMQQKKHIIVKDLASHDPLECNKILGLFLKDTMILPLNPGEKFLGLIQVANKRGRNPYGSEDLDLMQILGGQIAFVIQNADLFKNLQRAYIDTLSVLTGAIDAKDSYTKGHSDRVTEHSLKVARHMSLAPAEIEKVKLGGLLHDIGKIGIPESILKKPGRLTDEEFKIIKSHPELGVGILQKVEFLSEIVPLVKHHHERYDGKGYPEQLKGNEIPFLARLLSVADTYDAMTTDRPYRKALSKKEALEEIQSCSGTQFDPLIVVAFIEAIND